MSTEKVNDGNVGSEENSDRLSDGEGSLYDQEVSELNSVMEDFDRVMSMPDPEEKFYPTGRAARRAAEKRNRALMKRKPRA